MSSTLARGGGASAAAPVFDTLVVADWSANPRRRAVWCADLQRRALAPLAPPASGWTLTELLARARGLGERPLVGLDAALGVPRSFLAAVGAATFPDWLATTRPETYEPTAEPAAWRPARPFFRVPPKGRRAFEATAATYGVALRRAVEVRTGANPAFIVSGIPGAVGGATVDVWRALAREPHPPRLWPYAAEPPSAERAVTLAEVYPRAAYAAALSDGAWGTWKPRRLAKTQTAVRQAALAELHASAWRREFELHLPDTSLAVTSEDHFDALLTAAALLRATLAGAPLAELTQDEAIEGGILLAP